MLNRGGKVSDQGKSTSTPTSITQKDTSNKDPIELRVRKVVAESLCVELDEILMESNLIKDLGAEYIDFLDIMFRLEKEFDIKIPQREIENLARGGMTEEEFEVDGILQPKGRRRMAELIPEIDSEMFKEGMALREIPYLFTVAVFVGIVSRKLDGTLFTKSSRSTSPEVHT
jgi:acyl carrier protein